MIQKTGKYPHSPRQVLSYNEGKKNHTLRLRTQGKGKSAEFFAKLNAAELKKVVNYIEAEFAIHREDA